MAVRDWNHRASAPMMAPCVVMECPQRSLEFEMLKTVRILPLGLLLVAALLPMQVVSQQGAAVSQNELQITPDVVYGHKAGMALTFDVLRPANAHGGAVLYMVSGGWVSRWTPPQRLADRTFSGLLDEGLTVIAVRHGSAPRFKVPEAEADVRRALRYIRLHAGDLGVDADRLGVFGGSAGGHLSLMLGLGIGRIGCFLNGCRILPAGRHSAYHRRERALPSTGFPPGAGCCHLADFVRDSGRPAHALDPWRRGHARADQRQRDHVCRASS